MSEYCNEIIDEYCECVADGECDPTLLLFYAEIRSYAFAEVSSVLQNAAILFSLVISLVASSAVFLLFEYITRVFNWPTYTPILAFLVLFFVLMLIAYHYVKQELVKFAENRMSEYRKYEKVIKRRMLKELCEKRYVRESRKSISK